jgi:hypothetical protein
MLLVRPGLRLLDTFNFVSGARQTLDLQVPQRFIKRLYVWLRGTLTPGAGGDLVFHNDGPVNLLQQLELLVNGKTYKFGSGASFFRVGQVYDQTDGRNVGPAPTATIATTFEALVPLLFEAPSTVSPIDTFLDGRTVKNIILNLRWGVLTDYLLSGGTAPALSAVDAQVYIDDTDPFPTRQGFWSLRETEHQFLNIVTAGATRLAIPFTPGHIMRAVQLRAIDGTNVSDAVINRLSLRLNGEETPLQDLEDDFLQALGLHKFGRDTVAEGYYHVEVAEAGRIATTGLGAGGKPITDVEIVADTTVGAGATSIVAHTIEHVPPGA